MSVFVNKEKTIVQYIGLLQGCGLEWNFKNQVSYLYCYICSNSLFLFLSLSLSGSVNGKRYFSCKPNYGGINCAKLLKIDK